MISMLTIVCNEAHRLEACIASVRSVIDEVVVVVQDSTDGTLELAKCLADRIVMDRCHLLSEPSRELGLATCTQEWILALDGDEVLTDHGRQDLRWICENATCNAFLLPHTTTIGDCVVERIPRMRLFRRSCVWGPKDIHSSYMLKSGEPLLIGGLDWVDHRKTWDEQNLDNERYSRWISTLSKS